MFSGDSEFAKLIEIFSSSDELDDWTAEEVIDKAFYKLTALGLFYIEIFPNFHSNFYYQRQTDYRDGHLYLTESLA